MKQELKVIKVGGKIVEDPTALRDFIQKFNTISGAKLLVHGGGRSATQMANNLGIETQMVNGRRITDKAMLDIVTMVYGGLVNKNIVASLQAEGVNAIGLTGADANLILSHKREVKEVDYGYVGDVDEVNSLFLGQLLYSNLVPVVAPLTHNGKGDILNTNADTIAAACATGMVDLYDVKLIYCFEKNGVLADASNENSVIPHITPSQFQQLVAEGVVEGGMIPKLENSIEALNKGVCEVLITSVDQLGTEKGTHISLDTVE